MTQHAASINQYTTIETYEDLQFIYKTDSASGKTTLSVWNDTTKRYVIENHLIDNSTKTDELIQYFKNQTDTN
jgi:hypothetical protein